MYKRVVNLLHVSAFFWHLQGGIQQQKNTLIAGYIKDVK
jgi:hypothetical protein